MRLDGRCEKGLLPTLHVIMYWCVSLGSMGDS